MTRNSRRAGFTLVELMVVVAIIGILAAIGVPRLIAYARTSETAEAAQHASRIANAISQYVETQGASIDRVIQQINANPNVSVEPGSNDLSSVITVVSIAPDANFDYTVSAAKATDGPNSGGVALCIKAAGRATSGVESGTVFYSNAETVADGWQGNVNRVPYVNGGTTGLSAGGYCSASGSATNTCTSCGGESDD